MVGEDATMQAEEFFLRGVFEHQEPKMSSRDRISKTISHDGRADDKRYSMSSHLHSDIAVSYRLIPQKG